MRFPQEQKEQVSTSLNTQDFIMKAPSTKVHRTGRFPKKLIANYFQSSNSSVDAGPHNA